MSLSAVEVVGSFEWVILECRRCGWLKDIDTFGTVADFVAGSEHRCSPVIDASVELPDPSVFGCAPVHGDACEGKHEAP